MHLADIHVRLYKRHAEYTAVFQTLYDLLEKRDLTDTAIVIVGDIVHSKTDMSPEMVQMVSNFLAKLSSLAPTVVIPGNHDLNLSNPNRLDALSPIIENLNIDNLYYFRESGIYNFANLQFGVHSIIGSTDDWPSPSDMVDTLPKIALYHAPVNQAQTDTGYKITNHVTVEDFNGYDMVMLGDIHRTQILQEKSTGKPEIGYCGSLVQQNHGESSFGHGYYVWDVATAAIEEFVEVPNKYGYYTITLDDNKSMPATPDMPENVRLRIFVGDVDDTIVKKAISILRKDYTIIECIVNRTKSIMSNATSAANTLSTIDNMNEASQQNIHIRDFIVNQFPNTASDLIDKICEINTTLNGRIGDDELPRNISWKPLLLEFNNLFSYGENNKINFADMSGLYGVFSPNATGKTSAFDALCFALYDKTPRAFKGSHIMNTRKNEFKCTLTVSIENVKYVIERTGSRKKNGEVKVDVNFYRIDKKNNEEIYVSLNGEDRRDTNIAIRSYVGTYEDFILTTLSVQNQNTLFIETGQSDRKDLLSQFIGLTVFDKLLNLATAEINEVAGALKSFKKTDFTQTLANVQIELQHLQTAYDTASQHTNKLQLDVVELNNNIDETKKAIMPVPTDGIGTIHERTARLAKLNGELGTLFDARIVASELRNAEETKLRDLQTKLKTLDTNDENLVSVQKQYADAQTALVRLRAKVQTLHADERHIYEKMQNLKKHKYDPNCKFCINSVFVLDATEAEKQYCAIRTKIIELEDQIRQDATFVESIKDDVDKYETWLHLSDQIRTIKTALIPLEREEFTIETSLVTLTNTVAEHKESIASMARYNDIIIRNKSLEIQIDADIKTKQTLEAEIVNRSGALMDMFGKISVLQAQKEVIINSIKEAEELETIYEAYETYINVIGRDGLPYKLIGSIIPTIQSEVNNILEQIVDFTISLEVDGKNINGRIIYDDDRMWPLELASGMERFIGGLAIRIALMSISNLPKSNFLVIDEGFATLDADNLSSMNMMFDILSEQFDFIILISHLDSMRDVVDNIIEIRRDDNFSQINL